MWHVRPDLGGPPRSYMVEGDWPDGQIEGPAEAHYAHQLAVRLRAAIGERSLREVARAANLDHTTISAIVAGQRWADLVTVARLETALETRLWPEIQD